MLSESASGASEEMTEMSLGIMGAMEESLGKESLGRVWLRLAPGAAERGAEPLMYWRPFCFLGGEKST